MTEAPTGASATEWLRPRFHFTPRRNWINDPNGLVWVGGVYHLFFQHNPHGDQWGNMSWGHATSTDLVGWAEHPVAIPFAPGEQVYSGSVVVDHANTSGFGDGVTPPLVAAYTSVSDDRRQAQSLAVSVDGGSTWRRHTGNPVLDRGTTEFRDPKVFRFADSDGRERWIMVAVEAVRREVLIHRSENLRDWTWESTLGPIGPADVVWECPDLFALDVDGDAAQRRWVLVVSTNPGGPVSGSTTSYLVGGFDGHTFTPDPGGWRFVDHGRDFYAAVSFDNMPDGRRILLGWASNWDYAAHVPTSPWRGAMTLPRELALATRDGRATLVQSVPPEFAAALAADAWTWEPSPLGEPVRFTPGAHCRLRLEWQLGTATAVGVDLLVAGAARTRLRYETATGLLSLDRTLSGDVDFDPLFASVSSAAVPAQSGRLVLDVFVDGCLVEVFADGGAVTITDQVFPPADARDAVFFVEGGTAVLTAQCIALGRVTTAACAVPESQT